MFFSVVLAAKKLFAAKTVFFYTVLADYSI